MDWGHKEPIDNFTWLSNVTVRRKARTNLGDTARLRVALDRLKTLPADQTFTVSFVGGSVTAGQGAQDGKVRAHEFVVLILCIGGWWSEAGTDLHRVIRGGQHHCRPRCTGWQGEERLFTGGWW